MTKLARNRHRHVRSRRVAFPKGAFAAPLGGVADGQTRRVAGVRVIVTRPRAQAGPLVGRLEALGRRGCRVPADRDRANVGRARRLRRLRLAGRDEPERRRRDRAARGERASCRGGRLRARRRRCARTGIEPAFVAHESSQDGLLREFPRPAGRVLFAAAEGARRGPIDELGADFVPLYRTRLLSPAPPAGDVVVLASGSAARAYAAIGGNAPAVTIGPETSSVARSVGLTVRAEAATHDLDGLVAAVRGLL